MAISTFADVTTVNNLTADIEAALKPVAAKDGTQITLSKCRAGLDKVSYELSATLSAGPDKSTIDVLTADIGAALQPIADQDGIQIALSKCRAGIDKVSFELGANVIPGPDKSQPWVDDNDDDPGLGASLYL